MPATCTGCLGVMDDAVRPALADHHFQRVEHQLGAQMIGHRPADDLAAPGIQHDGEVQKAACRRHEGDVRHPELVRPGGDEVPIDQIRGGSGFLCPPRGRRPGAPAAGADESGRAHQSGDALAPVLLASCLERGLHPRRTIRLA